MNSTGGSPIGNQELLRRLRETQALLIKFSEENGRLARDNDKLQVSATVAYDALLLPRCLSTHQLVAFASCLDLPGSQPWSISL